MTKSLKEIYMINKEEWTKEEIKRLESVLENAVLIACSNGMSINGENKEVLLKLWKEIVRV
jgi:hypothetical protein